MGVIIPGKVNSLVALTVAHEKEMKAVHSKIRYLATECYDAKDALEDLQELLALVKQADINAFNIFRDFQEIVKDFQ